MYPQELEAYVKVAYELGVTHSSHALAKASQRAAPDPEAEAVSRACENAAHTFASLIANDDEVLAAIRELDDGAEMVKEIREVNQAWTDAGEVFLQSMHKKKVAS
jgi:dsDNA-specific endonuclease/ATPase MutS2